MKAPNFINSAHRPARPQSAVKPTRNPLAVNTALSPTHTIAAALAIGTLYLLGLMVIHQLAG